jgi:hypothetical protein
MNTTALADAGPARLPHRAWLRTRCWAGRRVCNWAGYIAWQLYSLAGIFDDLEWKGGIVAKGQSPAAITAARYAKDAALEAWREQLSSSHDCGPGSLYSFARGSLRQPAQGASADAWAAYRADQKWIACVACSACGQQWEFDETPAVRDWNGDVVGANPLRLRPSEVKRSRAAGES